MKKIVMFLTLCLAANMLNAENLFAPDFVDHNDNDHKFEMTDTGWNAKGFWKGGGNALTNTTLSWAVGSKSYSVVQTLTITNSCSDLEFSFDWTPASTVQSNASLTLSYQVFAWTTNSSLEVGDIMVNGVNFAGTEIMDENYDCEAYDFLANKVASAGSSGRANPVVHTVTGVAGVTTNVTLTLSTLIPLQDNLDDYDYLGVRFFIKSEGDEGNVGSTVENISMIPLDTAGPSILIYDDFDYGQGTALTNFVGNALEPDIAPTGTAWSGTVDYGDGDKWVEATNGYARLGVKYTHNGGSAWLPIYNPADYVSAELRFTLHEVQRGMSGLIGFSGPLAVSGSDGVWTNATSDGLYLAFVQRAYWNESVEALKDKADGATGLYYGSSTNQLVCFTNILGNAKSEYFTRDWSMKVDFSGKTVSVYRDGDLVVDTFALPADFNHENTFDSVTMADEYSIYEYNTKSVLYDSLTVIVTPDTATPPPPKGTVILLQ